MLENLQRSAPRNRKIANDLMRLQRSYFGTRDHRTAEVDHLEVDLGGGETLVAVRTYYRSSAHTRPRLTSVTFKPPRGRLSVLDLCVRHLRRPV